MSSIASSAFSREWRLLLACCAVAEISSSKILSAEDNVDIQALIALAEAHGVTVQLAARLCSEDQSSVPSSLQSDLISARRAQVISTMPLIAELFRVLDILQAASIDAVVVKGPALAVRAFGDSAARQYGDIDMLLRSVDVGRGSEVLAAAGFQTSISGEAISAQKAPGQYMFRRSADSPLIELHTERTLRYFPQPLPIDEFFERRTAVNIDGKAVPALSAEDEFVLISIHGAKHFWERLMWIADIAAMVHNCRDINWKRIKKTAAQVGAERMARVALLLANRVLGAAIPEEMEREVAADSTCGKLVRKIESWLPYAGSEPPALVQRAFFRFQMRGHLLAGARYLTRLSLSPTEDDWIESSNAPAATLRESLGRPFRLAKKYRRGSKESRER